MCVQYGMWNLLGWRLEQFHAVCPTVEDLTADGIECLPWTWFVRWQENPTKGYVMFLSLATILTIFPVL